MENLEHVVQEFLTEEGFQLKNALAYAGLGITKTTGQASEIISGVGFSGQQYGPDRQVRMAEILGEMLFYWHVLASTTEIPYEEIIAQYIAAYEATKVTSKEPLHKISLQDMMDMRKHVKAGALARDIDRELDNREKRKSREKLL